MSVLNPKACLQVFLSGVKHELLMPEHPVGTGLSMVLEEGQDGGSVARGRSSREHFSVP